MLALADGRIVAPTGKSTLGAFGPDQDTPLWTAEVGPGRLRAGALATGDLVVAGDDSGALVALDAATGARRWQRSLGAPLLERPAAGALLYVPTPRGRVVALDPATGAERWRLALRDTTVRFGPPAVQGGALVLVATDGHVRLLDARTGTVQWEAVLDGAITAAPLLTEAHVFVGTHRKKLVALDRATGAVVWEQTLRGRVKSALSARRGLRDRPHRRPRRALLSPRGGGGRPSPLMPMRLRLAAALLLVCAGAQAQTRVLTLQTNAPDALVFVDSVYVGPARESPFRIALGAAAVTLRPPSGTWSVRTARAPVPPGEAPVLRLDLPYSYRIESQPFDATVLLETASGLRTRLGTTPLDLVRDEPLEGTLVVTRDGYAAARATPGAQVWNRTVVALTPVAAPLSEGYAEVFAPRRVWLDVALVGVAAAATAVSVRYKFEADDLFDQYRLSGDPTLRPRIRRLDTRAGIALGVAGAGIGVFSLRLALRR